MDMIGKIRRLHARDKLSEREIARKTGLSRNTVSKWLRAPVNEAPKYRRERRPNKLNAFEEMLKQALTADARRPKHERRTARALHTQIKTEGYTGGYSVPCELAGQMVSTRLYPGSVVVVADDAVVARHERLSNAGGTRYDWQHYILLVQRKPGALRNGAPFADMPEALERLRRGLLRQAGGDRVMAQVLAIVPAAGLEAVIVAAELAMENRLAR